MLFAWRHPKTVGPKSASQWTRTHLFSYRILKVSIQEMTSYCAWRTEMAYTASHCHMRYLWPILIWEIGWPQFTDRRPPHNHYKCGAVADTVYITVQTLGLIGCFRRNSLMLTKAAFDQKYNKNSNIVNDVKYLYFYFNILKYNLFLMWQSWIFSSHYSRLCCHMVLQKSRNISYYQCTVTFDQLNASLLNKTPQSLVRKCASVICCHIRS